MSYEWNKFREVIWFSLFCQIT